MRASGVIKVAKWKAGDGQGKVLQMMIEFVIHWCFSDKLEH